MPLAESYTMADLFSVSLVVETQHKVGADSLLSMYVDSAGNVLDAVFAGVLLAMFAFAMREDIIDWISGIKHVKTIHFNDLEECLHLLAHAIQRYNRNVKLAHITMDSPLIFSKSYVSYFYDQSKSGDPNHSNNHPKLEKAKLNCIDYINHIQFTVDQIVKESEGAYDKTLLGRTGRPEIDHATYQVAEKMYDLGGKVIPGSTELGFHSNNNEYGTYIFGECQNGNSRPSKFHFMMLVHFDTDFKNLCGYICDESDTIEQNFEFSNFKHKHADMRVISNNEQKLFFSKKEDNNKPKNLGEGEWKSFCSELEAFLLN